MKKLILSIIGIMFAFSMISAGEMYYITSVNGVAKVTEQKAIVLNPLDGMKGVSLAAIEKMGITMVKFVFEPGAKFPLHTGPEQWIGYSVSGNVLSNIGTKNTVDTTRIIKPGDTTVFEGNTYHAWEVIGKEPWVSIWFRKL
jgi:quercetin dioxygenase-like cupin family protein